MNNFVVSKSAFNISIPVTLTNEIPHMPLYNILNRNLRDDWSRQLLGVVDTGYTKVRESQKTINGSKSSNYQPKTVYFADPKTDKRFVVKLDKVNFSVKGMLETEIDYLMHEMSRYLTKLYPDDFNTVQTLTEAERQSYFNEALHMVHSYFDTEQISGDDQYKDLFLRNRFLTGITPIRSLTGVQQQEQFLTNLFNVGDLTSWTGYKNYIDNKGIKVLTRDVTKSDTKVTESLCYYYTDSNTISYKSLTLNYIKITDLRDLLGKQVITNLTKSYFNQDLLKQFQVIQDIDTYQQLLTQLVYTGRLGSINTWFQDMTRAGEVPRNTSLISLKRTSYGNRSLNDLLYLGKEKLQFLYVDDEAELSLVPLIDHEFATPQQLVQLADKKIVTSDLFKKLEKLFVLTLSKASYLRSSIQLCENIVASSLYKCLQRNNLQFSRAFSSLSMVKPYFMQVTISQNNKRVFQAILNNEVLTGGIDFLKTIERYSYEQVSQDFFGLFKYKTFIDNNEVIDLNIGKLYNIDFTFIELEDFLENTYVFEDVLNISGTDEDCRIFYKENDISMVGNKGTIQIHNLKTQHKYYGSIDKFNNATLFSKTDPNTDIKITVQKNIIKVQRDTHEYEFTINNNVVRNKTNKIVGYLSIDPKMGLYNSSTLSFAESKLLDEPLSEVHPKAVYQNNRHNQVITCIHIAELENLQNLLINNTDVLLQNLQMGTSFAQVTQLIVRSSLLLENLAINRQTGIDLLFNQVVKDGRTFAYRCLGEMYAGNLIRTSNIQIMNIHQRQGRLYGLVIDYYGHKEPITVVNAEVKNDFCYLRFSEDLTYLLNQPRKTVQIIFDVQADILNPSTNSIISTKAEKRQVHTKSTYRILKQYYLHEISWYPLNYTNLNYLTDNLFSENILDFADNSDLSKKTTIPKTLVDLETLTLVDLGDSQVSFDLLRELITENKSLYLDSVLLSIIWTPVQKHSLLYNKQYSSYSYTFNDDVPALISFYNVDLYTSAYPLFNSLLNDPRDPVDFTDLQHQFNRRKMIWGDVVWDANVVKSIKTLRTIWAGFLSNFKIFSSEDMIPDEDQIKSNVSSMKQVYNQNILNYNYSDNKGNPTINWLFSSQLLTSGLQKSTVRLVQTKPVEIDNKLNTDLTFPENNETFIQGFTIEGNFLSIPDGSLKLQKINVDVHGIISDIDVLKIRSSNDLQIQYNSILKTYEIKSSKSIGNFTAGTIYKPQALYNQIFLKGENDKSAGFFQDLKNNQLELFLEFFVYQFVQSKILGWRSKQQVNLLKEIHIDSIFPNLSEPFRSRFLGSIVASDCPITINDIHKQFIEKYDLKPQAVLWRNFNESRSAEDKIKLKTDTIDWTQGLLKDVGTNINNDYIKDLQTELQKLRANKLLLSEILQFISEESSFIPVIVTLDPKDLYLILTSYRVFKEDDVFTVLEDSQKVMLNGDLVHSLLPLDYKHFQVKQSLFKTYSKAFNALQFLAPNTFTGEYVGLNIELDSKTVQDLQDDKDPEVRFSAAEKETLKKQQELLKDIFSKNVETTGLTIQIQDEPFSLQTLNKKFKEYDLDVVQFSTIEDVENKENAEIQRCNLHFNVNRKLKNKGYLYLFDIKTPTRRSTYTDSRETQIVDRNYVLKDLHILAVSQPESNLLRLLIQDSSKSLTKSVTSIIEKIKPNDLLKQYQVIQDSHLNIGFSYPDPGLRIGYTFYKRKFIAEFTTDSIDTTTFVLSDSRLRNSFDLNKHISVGDSVQLKLLNPSSFYQEGIPVNLTITDDTYVGPYKVIYEKIETKAGSTSSDHVNVNRSQKIILAGFGNLVYVEIDLVTGSCNISKPYLYQPASAVIFNRDGMLSYYDEVQQGVVDLGTIYSFIKHAGQPLEIDKAFSQEGSNGQTVTATDTIPSTPLLPPQIKQTLTKTHMDWYSFDKTNVSTETTVDEGVVVPKSPEDVSEDEAAEPSGEVLKATPTELTESLPIFDGSLQFDNYDRIYFKPNPETTTKPAWRALPDEGEFFESCEKPGTFTLENKELKTLDVYHIESATSSQLCTFIRKQLTSMLNENDDSVITGGITNEENFIENPSDFKDKNNHFRTLKAGTHLEVSSIAIAQLLYDPDLKEVGQKIDLSTHPIYLPTLKKYDVPVYLNSDSTPKWQSVYVLTGTTKIEIEKVTELEQLKEFALALQSVNYITRKIPRITSYIKDKQHFITWDQTTGTLNIMDKVGNLKHRKAIDTIGFKQPSVMDSSVTGRASNAYNISSRLYALTNEDILKQYVDQVNARDIVEVEDKKYGIYEVFELDKPLHLPTVLKDYSDKTKEQLHDDLKTIIVNESERSELIDLLLQVSKTETYNTWRNTSKLMDYLAPDACEYVSFKDKKININLIGTLLEVLGKTTELGILKQVIAKVTDTLNPGLVKGIPYLTDSIIEAEKDVFGKGITSVSTTGQTTYSFESLIKTSGISIVDNYLHIYGTADWPDLSVISNRIKARIMSKLKTSTPESSLHKEKIAGQYVDEVVSEIKRKYRLFLGDEITYPPKGEKDVPFKVIVNLQDYSINSVENNIKIDTNSPAEILSITSAGENSLSITSQGIFKVGDPSSPILVVEDSEIEKVKVSKGLITVYDALKSLDSFGPNVQVEDNQITVQLNGILVPNSETFYSVILSVEKNQFKIRDNVVLLEDGQHTNVIAAVKNLTKDNFQFGYGQVTNLEQLPAASTLFEVKSPQYADFATYENEASGLRDIEIVPNQKIWSKPEVFSMYPTWEQMNENPELRSFFYETTNTGDLQYLTNEYNRSILRITPVFGDIAGGQIICRSQEPNAVHTKADEHINNIFLATNKDAVKYQLSDKRTVYNPYKKILNRYIPQQIPKLVPNPWDAIISHPYKIKKFEIDSNEITNLEVLDDYLVANIKLKNVQDPQDFANLYTGNVQTTFEKSNTTQVQQIVKKLKLEDIPNEELMKVPNLEMCFNPDGTLKKGFSFEFKGVEPNSNVEIDKTKTQAQNTFKISNGTMTQVHSTEYKGVLRGDWYTLQQNVNISNLLLKIVNKTPSLPKFTNINKFRSKIQNNDFVLDTDCYEIYIPAKGYGQSLIGDYTTPTDCVFENKIFFDIDYKTVNNKNQQFILVDQNGLPIKNKDNTDAVLPKLQFKSFVQADIQLNQELPVRAGFETKLKNVIVDLTLFNVDTQNISFDKESLLDELIFSKPPQGFVTDNPVKAQRDTIYELFTSKLKIACKIAWSELPPDVKNDRVFEIDSNELREKIGYTRSFENKTIPINYTYRLRDGSYVTTNNGYRRDLERFACDETGKVLYKDIDGNTVSTPTINPPIPAISAMESLRFFTVTNGTIDSIIQDAYILTKNVLQCDITKSLITCVKSDLMKTILILQDPNNAITQYSHITHPSWKKKLIPFKFRFTSDLLNINYQTKTDSYNFVYLKNKKGELISKIYFEKKVNKDNLLVFSLID